MAKDVEWPTQADDRVEFSHLEKTLWPEDGFTKGDLIDYLRAVGPVMLPYFRDRPITLRVFPAGIHGRSFYRREIPESRPSRFRHVRYATATDRHDIELPLIDDVESLCWYANSGAIEFHLWASHAPELAEPDLVIFDLDFSDGTNFSRILEAGALLRAALVDVGLRSYPKTSGGRGLHVYLPLAPGYEFDEVRSWVEAMSQRLASEHPGLFAVAKGGTHLTELITIDAAQNSIGRNTAAPYTPRGLPGAPVSTPLTWEEVERGHIRPADFTIHTAPGRIAKFGDLMAPLLGQKQKLPPVSK